MKHSGLTFMGSFATPFVVGLLDCCKASSATCASMVIGAPYILYKVGAPVLLAHVALDVMSEEV